MPQSRLTVLIVEDDADLNLLLSSCAQGCGFRTISASTRKEAFSLIGDADILLTDLIMPNGEIDALVSEWVQRKGIDSCIVLSGYLTPKLKSTLMTSGVTYVCDKPAELHVLLTILRRIERYVRLLARVDELEQEVIRLRKVVESHVRP